MPMILGLDAGASNTRVITAEYGQDRKPSPCRELLLGPGNFRHLGRSGIASMVCEIIEECGLEPSARWSVVGGFAGAGTTQSRQDIRTVFERAGFPANRIHITNDADLLLDAVGEGIVLIAGTGSVCMGRSKRNSDRGANGNRVQVRSGGYGFRMPSEIGGYFLGIHAIDIALQVADGRRDGSSLHRLVMDHLGLASAVEITPLLYPEEEAFRVQETVAALAPLVLQAAADGDRSAANLVATMVDGLAEHLVSVHARLGVGGTVVALHGGLFASPRAIELLIDPLRHHPLVRNRGLQFRTNLSVDDPDPLLAAMGAILRAP